MNKPYVIDYVEKSGLPILPVIEALSPWEAVSTIRSVISAILDRLDLTDYIVADQQAIHRSAIIESSAQLKGPLIIGPSCFVANGSLLRDGVILDENTIVGHCGELKTSIMLVGSKMAHLNFIGDSIIGDGANIEGGAVIANYRNEWSKKEIQVCYDGNHLLTGVEKFGAMVGSGARIGANATLAPGCLISGGAIVRRGALVDQITPD